MKRILLPLLFFCSLAGLVAQRSAQIGESRLYSVKQGAKAEKSMSADTLLPGIFFEECADTLYTILADDGGYLAGTNDLLDREKAQFMYYDELASYDILGGVAYFAAYDAQISQRQLYAKLYAVDAITGGPGNLLATSQALVVQQIALSDNEFLPTVFTFPQAVTMNSPAFFIAIDFRDVYEVETGNIGLWSTNYNCGDGFNAWERWEDDTWHAINEEDGWNLNLEFFMGAIVAAGPISSQDDFVAVGNFQLFPNPASSFVWLDLSFDQSVLIADFSLFDALGREVLRRSLGPVNATTATTPHRFPIALEGLGRGWYSYRLRTNLGQQSGKLVLR